MSDLIERQKAIGALCSECQGRCIPCDSYPCSEVEAINALPSAQPEIIHCQECTNARWDNIFHQCWCRGRLVTPDHYCGYAERRAE